jgi:Sugar phosphate isomerases/epimerases
MHRRNFLKRASTGMAVAYFAPSLLSCGQQQAQDSSSTSPENVREIGLQLFTLRDQIARDLKGTLRRVAEIGYNHVETFGPVAGDGGQVRYWGLSTNDLQSILDETGLKTYSGHYDLADFLTPGNGNEDALKAYLDSAAALGQQYIIAPVPPMLLIDRLSVDDYRFMADQLNKGGELAASSGLKIGYHNHFWEFRPFEGGQHGLDVLLSNTDAERVVFELDLFWTEKSGIDSSAFFAQHPGRFPLWHIKDMDKNNAAPVIGPDFDKKPVMEITSAITYAEVGTGTIDFKKIMGEEKTAGLQLAFVEQDLITIDPYESITKSYQYVRDNLFST